MTQHDPPRGWSDDGARWSRRFTLGSFLEAVSFLEAIAPAVDDASAPVRVEFVYDQVDVALEPSPRGSEREALARLLDEKARAHGGAP